MCLVVGSRVIERVAWKPLRFGITTSIRIRSGNSRLADFNAGGAVFGGQRLVAEFFDDAADAHQLRRRIVDDQDASHVVFPGSRIDCSRHAAHRKRPL